MKALILAAGFGTRLAPHTRTLPKALFPVAGIPVLGRMITHLIRGGCTAIAVNTHHLSHLIASYLAENDFGVPLTVSHEPEILGTGGAIRRLAHFWDDDPFMVVNADIVTDIDLADVYRRHKLDGAQVTLVMHDRPAFNQVGVDEQNQITGFERVDRPTNQSPHRKMAFTGIHVMDIRILDRIPGSGFSDIIHVYRQMLDEGRPINAQVVRNHYWQDIGSPDGYRDAAADALAPEAFRSAFGDCQTPDIVRRRLSGDGSDRGWFRLTAGPHRLILADHGITTAPAGSEVNAFVRIGAHLFHCGLPVPRIHTHDGFSGLVFLEDLGDCHLQQVLQQKPHGSRIERLYQTIIDTLLDLTEKALEGFNPDWTCQTRAYDAALILEKECRYFVDAFLNGYLNMTVAHDSLTAEFEHLARCTIDHGVSGLIHRDFQSRNIMLRDDRHYLIDFQGARYGPVQYDLAALLIDPYAGLDQPLQERLLGYAAHQASDRLKSDPDTFIRGFRYCAVTRNLQILGAFGFLSRVKRKMGFERWIPAAAAMLVGNIRSADCRPLPKLTRIAEKIGSG
ncbi:sugar phosphate nucleotidyltransferase [Desulfosarcina sp.]|uniref:sugar phosphate nucleotidyltransferase n=1 Tax=Desulfosarcina sp. TaxID=2027861 RepID=UPI0039709618